MRLKTIVGIVLLVGFSALLFLNFGQEVGGYMNFEEAARTGQKAHVVGQWVEDKHFDYDPDRNIFRFHMKDKTGTVRKVLYPKPKPANFEKAEKLVLEGQMKNGTFYARQILVKCPSKYNSAKEFQQTTARE